MTYQLEQSRINEILKPLNAKLNAQPVKGVNEDDVVDLQDYAQESFGKSLSVLQANYWARAVAMAPRLSIEDRATLFSIIMGRNSRVDSNLYSICKNTGSIR